MLKSNNLTEQIIQGFTILRFPLAIFVIMQHHNFDIDWDAVNTWTQIENLAYRVLKIVDKVAVPCFYVISGFFFFLNVSEFKYTVYKKKLSKRFRSLIVPFILWNIIAYLFLLCKDIVTGNNTIPEGLLHFDSFMWSFLLFNGGTTPINAPLWFLRDLIVVVFLTPLIYLCIKKCPFIFLSVLIVLFFTFDKSPLYLIYPAQPYTAPLFFSIGSFIAINRHKFDKMHVNVTNTAIISITLIYAICILLLLYSDTPLLQTITFNFAGVLFTLLLALRIYNTKFCQSLIKLNSTCFFLFALHFLLINSCQSIVQWFIPKEEVLWLFIGSVIINTLLCMFSYYACRKVFPNVASVLSGGRS